ncbi:pilus assembly PilX family protein [Hydrogenophaga sp.]|jgi:type IV pilus assembly protein PilX|uniref:pilus assembly PilX family protein n=1 Tax=Hydrogenophaga sp. TaxID=1904254 RepID=UPI003F72DC17
MRLSKSPQRGVALLVVLAALLLTSIALLGSLQVGWLAERRVGSESDTQRAFAAAEALIRDAELDILGLRADGTRCDTNPTAQPPCRTGIGAGPFFPQDDEDLDLLRARVSAGHRQCLQGICLPDNVEALQGAWTTELAALTSGQGDSAIAATYGQFTGAAPQNDGNPLLGATTPRAWYWVEVFRYSQAAGILNPAGDTPIPDRRHSFVYRITAYANGLKPGTRVHLRSVFVPYPQTPLH